MARRTKEEFYCAECSRYFLTWLREDMTGNYSFECPNCGHIHYRFIKEGLITQDRHSSRAGVDHDTIHKSWDGNTGLVVSKAITGLTKMTTNNDGIVRL